ncbi:hypothetical protein CP533_3346 [Ophiocordyceps camponoti-saundersi (nom. inval.)]|nr:hypothetical protein CP533_3346 [Ophiocordyceps camponoti-saundersi (nom. inval.)]
MNDSTVSLPRVTIKFCTQCRWMLRAAYYAQELLSTFALAIGEVALQPSTGGTFVVAVTHHQAHQQQQQHHQQQPQTTTTNTNANPDIHPPDTNASTKANTDNNTSTSASASASTSTPTTTATTTTTILWDRSVDGGFPETKELKRRLRDLIEPGRNLGHVDGHRRATTEQPNKPDEARPCQDCPPPEADR